MAKRKQLVKEDKYQAQIKVLGRVYSAKGKSVTDALSNLSVSGKVAGFGVVTISKGKQSKDKIINRATLSRWFNLSPMMREIAIKNIALMFDL